MTCSNGTVTVNTMFCLTHSCSNSSNYRVVAGACPFSARTATSGYIMNFSSINECKESNIQVFYKNFNRHRRLCGECAEDHFLAVNSYSLDCMHLSACSAYNWLLFIIIYLTPVAIFFIVITSVSHRAMPMHTYCMHSWCQCRSTLCFCKEIGKWF